MNPTAWNASGKTGFFWYVMTSTGLARERANSEDRGGTALMMFVWAYFRLPETKGRTYEELDILFARKVSARKFSSVHVDAYETEVATEAPEKK